GNHTGGFAGDGNSATAAQLNQPGDVAADAAGNLLIADQNNKRIRVVAVSASNPGYPLRAIDCPSSTCTWTPGFIFSIAGTGVSGFSGGGGTATSAQLNAPGNVALDANGNVLIGDTGNHRIRVVAVSASNPGYPLRAIDCP